VNDQTQTASEKLQIVGTTFHDGKTIGYTMYLGKKKIGSITKPDGESKFIARIGSVTGSHIVPSKAATIAWQKLFERPSFDEYGYRKPMAIPAAIMASNRVTCRNAEYDADGRVAYAEVYVGDRKAGTVRRYQNRYLAMIEDVERAAITPVTAAQLAWINASENKRA